MTCLYCQKALTKGFPIYRLTYDPAEQAARFQPQRPLNEEPLLGHVCSLEHGYLWMKAQTDRPKRLRMVTFPG